LLISTGTFCYILYANYYGTDYLGILLLDSSLRLLEFLEWGIEAVAGDSIGNIHHIQMVCAFLLRYKTTCGLGPGCHRRLEVHRWLCAVLPTIPSLVSLSSVPVWPLHTRMYSRTLRSYPPGWNAFPRLSTSVPFPYMLPQHSSSVPNTPARTIFSWYTFIVHRSYPLFVLLEFLKVLKAWETEIITRCAIISTAVSRHMPIYSH
jgi:hypothetical protein